MTTDPKNPDAPQGRLSGKQEDATASSRNKGAPGAQGVQGDHDAAAPMEPSIEPPAAPQSQLPGELPRQSQDQSARPSPRLLEFLVCPVTKSTLELSRDHSELISRRARLAFPIRDGIALLTRDTARDLTDDD